MKLENIEWDEDKNEKNKSFHHTSFEVAQYVFADPKRIERRDESEGNNSGEERWQTIGKIGRLYFVVYTERGEVKRLISARPAEPGERRSYNGYYTIDNKGWTKDT
jgi:uncharacterized DUF497 family protein